MWILGVNAGPAGWHDPSACLVNENGEVIAFAEEERFLREKHALHRGPLRATQYSLREAGISPHEVDVVAVGWDVPYVSRLYGKVWDFEAGPAFLRQALGWDVSWRTMPDLVFVRHHLAHARVAFHASGYDSAAVVVIDGSGDDESISIFHAIHGRELVRKRAWPMSHSLGWLYEAATRFVGLHFLETGKTMGLAAYGRERDLEPWLLVRDHGEDFLQPCIAIPADYHYDFVIRAWGRAFEQHGGREVTSGSQLLHRDKSAVMTAWSAQAAVERQLSRLVDLARTITGEQRVCLSGGVALNCSANGRVSEPIYVPPIPHDAGVALGAAWQVAPPQATTPLSPYLGPQVTTAMPGASERSGITTLPLNLEQLSHAISSGRIGAIAEGRAEVGPRALGHRSIVASPTPRAMQDRLNMLKNREPWRPFGPVALRSRCDPLWERREHLSRYMVGSVPVTDDAYTTIPAAIHVDGTTRPQTLDDESTDLVARILTQPAPMAHVALINTSFNTRGKPIVNTGCDALHAFRAMDLDFLVLDGEVLVKGADWWGAR